MSLLVQKYGGTSIGDTQRIGALAERVKASRATGDDIVVVVSAMSRETDRLAVLYEKIGGNDARESDFVLASGEQVAAGLTAAALQAIGVSARSFNGAQAGIITDNAHGKARIIDISTRTLRDALEVGQNAGHYRISRHNRRRRHHHFGTGRFGHDGRSAGGGIGRRRMPNIHRCRRHIHHRPARLQKSAFTERSHL